MSWTVPVFRVPSLPYHKQPLQKRAEMATVRQRLKDLHWKECESRTAGSYKGKLMPWISLCEIYKLVPRLLCSFHIWFAEPGRECKMRHYWFNKPSRVRALLELRTHA